MKNEKSVGKFTCNVSNEIAQEFYSKVFGAASKPGQDVRIKKKEDGSLKIQSVKTETIS